MHCKALVMRTLVYRLFFYDYSDVQIFTQKPVITIHPVKAIIDEAIGINGKRIRYCAEMWQQVDCLGLQLLFLIFRSFARTCWDMFFQGTAGTSCKTMFRLRPAKKFCETKVQKYEEGEEEEEEGGKEDNEEGKKMGWVLRQHKRFDCSTARPRKHNIKTVLVFPLRRHHALSRNLGS